MGWSKGGVQAQNHFRDITLARSGDPGAIRRLKALSGIILKEWLHDRLPRLTVKRREVIKKPRIATPREIQEVVPGKFLRLFSGFEQVRLSIDSVSRLAAYCFGEGLLSMDRGTRVSSRDEELPLGEMLKRYRGVHDVMNVDADCKFKHISPERAGFIIDLSIQPNFYVNRHTLLGNYWSMSESIEIEFT
jgi:hypothetical protein